MPCRRRLPALRLPRVRAPLALASLLALLGVALALPACTSVNPVTGRREVVLMSAEEERQIDEMASQQIEAQMGVVQNDALAAYVAGVGDALATHSPRQDVTYHFQVVEMQEPNAFALPGGHVYVSRGLLIAANSESELANVLGHEIGHVAARHAARQDSHVKTLGLATLLTELLGGGPESSGSERVSGHFIARYAREQEREADRIGQDLAIAAGVDPRGLGEFLRKLDGLARLTQGFSTPQSYFATHPAASERMLEAASRAQQREWQAAAAPGGDRIALDAPEDRERYLDRIEGMAVERPASEGLFLDDGRFLHPDLNFSLRFPHGWETLNQSSQVVGISPKRDAVVLLQLDSEGDDPAAAALAYAEREMLRLENTTAIRIGGLPAVRAEAAVPTSFGRIPAEITWIAHEGRIYRLVTGMPPGKLRRYQGLFRKFSHSFRPLTQEDRALVTELRLRTARARPGESLEALAARTGNEWSPVYTAVVNGLPVGSMPPPGYRLKIAVREPYDARPADASEAAQREATRPPDAVGPPS